MSSIMGLPADDLLKPPGFDAPITQTSYDDGVRAGIAKALEAIKEEWKELDLRFGEIQECNAAQKTAKWIYDKVEKLTKEKGEPK